MKYCVVFRVQWTPDPIWLLKLQLILEIDAGILNLLDKGLQCHFLFWAFLRSYPKTRQPFPALLPHSTAGSGPVAATSPLGCWLHQ